MEELLPYYERELSFLRRYSRDFAERYPKIAARLALSGEHCEDPHVERMIESFALLGARINKKLDDDYPEFTEALLEVLYPHYLRPFPSCSIAQFTPASPGQQTEPVVIGRGTELKSRPIRGVQCRFRTAYDVTLAPIRISEARYTPVALAPSATVLPSNATGVISITFESLAAQLDLGALKVPTLRAHLHGEQSFVAALTDCLFVNVLGAYVEPERNGRWTALRKLPIEQAGFDEDDALIDYPAKSHPAYRLLTEYFAFPDKFDFVDFDLAAIARASGRCQRATLHLVLQDVRSDSHVARLLELLTASHFRLFCTPIVNLFRQHGEPIRITHRAVSYPVIAEARRAFAYEVYSIDSVKLVRQQAHEESVIEFRPFYSLHHGEAARIGHYWFARRNDWVAQKSPGYETEISIVDIDFEPTSPQTDTLSLDLTCTNRDLPAMLAFGLEGGDLFQEGGAQTSGISMLRRPTQSVRFERGRAAHWRLVSHLALNHVSLVAHGLAPLKEMLTLYDLRRTAVSMRQIDGLAGIEQRGAVQWLPGKPFATFVRGIEIRLTIDEEHFVGASLASFVRVLDSFFGLYVHLNSFVQLVVVSKRTGEEIIRCKPRTGESILA
ncbi:type VI secretion system baseplate subunit TssF [Burkholderia cepacia]|uniref:Type VI secretion system baseplate subunit TssF n=1 Tax=Burkholderia cepacia TaxID=292 RepID=A0A2S8IJV1_BURCE|nr:MULTISPECIES: type VI secretion system baseplate subunit TssF [Burkholderia]EKS9887613.1 type VI secretion system baseplate subunit TssF [Burkholderia pyrrocinia]EKS9896114.1 type VI secretion system baseplate subunit TssF [Burkholderia pyrrocinia]EKS9909147.1 type VI secretion system baseplate subunit TssF [Burkholderia pyrrocinia]PQP15077.1 type VI secretion system baseplate subunit TssF [Burkholderia cepacia]TDA46735.1 type VI secretion system baseplate subunit TssF [Burkholderia pyrroci